MRARGRTGTSLPGRAVPSNPLSRHVGCDVVAWERKPGEGGRSRLLKEEEYIVLPENTLEGGRPRALPNVLPVAREGHLGVDQVPRERDGGRALGPI